MSLETRQHCQHMRMRQTDEKHPDILVCEECGKVVVMRRKPLSMLTKALIILDIVALIGLISSVLTVLRLFHII